MILLIRVLIIFVLLSINSVACVSVSAGTTTANGYFYLPDYGARGAAEYNLYNNALIATDVKLKAMYNAYLTGGAIEVPMVDYGATSTVVGWSLVSGITRVIEVKKIGKTVFVNFHISGTSNSTSTSFTLPYKCKSYPGVSFMSQAQDASGNTVVGSSNMFYDAFTVILHPVLDSIPWTATGTKVVAGQFFYETE